MDVDRRMFSPHPRGDNPNMPSIDAVFAIMTKLIGIRFGSDLMLEFNDCVRAVKNRIAMLKIYCG